MEDAVGVEKFTYSTKDLCAELDQRIAKLEQFRDKLQTKIKDKVSVSKNQESLKKVSTSLSYATQARSAMASSCCDQSCDYELQDS